MDDESDESTEQLDVAGAGKGESQGQAETEMKHGIDYRDTAKNIEWHIYKTV